MFWLSELDQPATERGRERERFCELQREAAQLLAWLWHSGFILLLFSFWCLPQEERAF